MSIHFTRLGLYDSGYQTITNALYFPNILSYDTLLHKPYIGGPSVAYSSTVPDKVTGPWVSEANLYGPTSNSFFVYFDGSIQNASWTAKNWDMSSFNTFTTGIASYINTHMPVDIKSAWKNSVNCLVVYSMSSNIYGNVSFFWIYPGNDPNAEVVI